MSRLKQEGNADPSFKPDFSISMSRSFEGHNVLWHMSVKVLTKATCVWICSKSVN